MKLLYIEIAAVRDRTESRASVKTSEKFNTTDELVIGATPKRIADRRRLKATYIIIAAASFVEETPKNYYLRFYFTFG